MKIKYLKSIKTPWGNKFSVKDPSPDVIIRFPIIPPESVKGCSLPPIRPKKIKTAQIVKKIIIKILISARIVSIKF